MTAHPEFGNMKALRLLQDKDMRKTKVFHYKSFSLFMFENWPLSLTKKNIDGF
jgi:hypothetical protein